MKIIVVMGSSRKGNTYHISEEIGKQLKAIDSTIIYEYLWLKDYHLENCKGCGLCFDKGENYCPCHDQRDEILSILKEADGIILSTPVYVLQMSGQMKTLLDRFAYLTHRPSFWGKTGLIIGTVFANPHLKQTLTTMAYSCKSWGCQLVSQEGFASCAMHNYKDKQFINKKRVKQIIRTAKKFYLTTKTNNFQTPDILGLLRFEIQKISLKNGTNRDSQYFYEQGWMDSKKDYYYPVHINLVKKFIIKQASKIIVKIFKME